jgi:hypothetical protein
MYYLRIILVIFDFMQFKVLIFNFLWSIRSRLWIVYAVIAFISSYFTAISSTGTDFDAYIDAARKLSLGGNIYNAHQPFHSMQYYYSVFFAWILSFFCDYSSLCQLIWNLLSFYLLYRVYKQLTAYLNMSSLASNRQVLFHFIFFVLCIFIFNIHVSRNQMTAFILWTIFEAYRLLNQQKTTMAAAIFGLGLNIKLLSIPSILVFLQRSRFKFLILVLFFTGLYILLPSIDLGLGRNFELHQNWWSVINPTNKEHKLDLESIGMICLSNYVSAYFYSDDKTKGLCEPFIRLSYQEVSLLILILRIMFIAPAFLIWKRSIAFSKSEQFLLYYICLITPLLLPHQHKYALFFSYPMIAYILKYIIEAGFKTNKWFLILFIIALIPFSPIYGSEVLGKYLFKTSQTIKVLVYSQSILAGLGFYLWKKQ